MQRLGIGLLLAGVVLWSMPGITMAQPITNDGCNLNHVANGFCDIPVVGADPTDNCGCDWVETFDTYPNNTTLARGTNFWYGWEDNPATQGFITNEVPDHTSGTGRSLRALFDASADPDIQIDQVHWFTGRLTTGTPLTNGTLALGDGAGYDTDVSDYWILDGWILIPTAHTGDSFVIVNSWYTRGTLFPPNAGPKWHVEFQFSSGTGRVWEDLLGDPPAAPFLPLVKGVWVKWEARINLNPTQNNAVLYYDGQFLAAHSWTGVVAGGTPDMLMIGNLDLFVSTGTATYYDDLSLTATETPPINTPTFTCVRDERNDDTGCTEYVWTVTNKNLVGDILEFYIDVAAGSGAKHGTGTCVGGPGSADAMTAPAGWTKQNCTSWNKGHALFKFTKSAPGIAPLETVQGRLKIDPNRSVLVNDLTAGISCNAGAGINVPPYTVLVSAGQILGNEISATCAADVYSFGPCYFDPGPIGQKWSAITRCDSFLNAPSTSTWAKVVLAMLLVAGGSMLVLRSRRVAA